MGYGSNGCLTAMGTKKWQERSTTHAFRRKFGRQQLSLPIRRPGKLLRTNGIRVYSIELYQSDFRRPSKGTKDIVYKLCKQYLVLFSADASVEAMGRQEIGRKKLNAKFFVRILPSLDFALDSIKIESNLRVMHVKCLQNSGNLKKKDGKTFWRFTADDIFWNASQEDVYRSVCKELVERAVAGVSSVIVAYGQNGSGKTFTISGLRHHYEDRGLLLRILASFCYERSCCRDFKNIKISMSYVEFLRGEMKDLFSNRLIEKFKDVKKKDIVDEIDAWRSIFDAEVQKSFDCKAPYAGSHRGHTVFTFHVQSMSLTDSHPRCTCSKVHVVDMSGIDSGNSPTIWRCNSDLGYSNLSKALMEQLILCITGKTWKSPGCVCPFKTTKLLDYLRDTLQPYCSLRFIGHIIGSESNLPLTLSVLRFGEKVRGFQPSRLEQEISQCDALVTLRALEAEIERLRAELDLKDMLNDSPNYSNLSQDKLQQIRRAAKNFLTGNLDKLTLLNLGQAEITLDVFKEVYERSAREKDQAVKDAVLAAIEDIQMQLPPDKTHGVVSLTSGQTRTSRRRISRQHDPHVSTTAPLRVKTSETNVVRSGTATAQVGQLDRKGIGIGSGMNSPSVESPLAKALKKVRSRKLDTVARLAPKSNSIKDRAAPSPRDFSGVDCQAALPGKVPSREEAWHDFCIERSDVIQGYQDEISRLEESVRITRKNYAVALCELGKARDALERTRKDWEDWKHVQHVRKRPPEGEEEDESFVKIYAEGLQKREIDIDNAAERCHVTLIDFRNCVDELSEAKAVLENEFQMFCEDVYKTAVIPEDHNLPECQFGTPTESIAELEAMDQIRMEMYSQFRQKILSYVPKRKKTEWVTRF